MDTKQIEYILKIAEENNITHAAEKLFITQSALNQQLLKLEKELGTPLFHRSRANWRLTEAGEVYVKNAREMLHLKKDTYNQIRDIAEIRKGRLSVGFTPGRGIAMFTSVYPAFHQEYPNIIVEPVEKNVLEMQSMISDESLDICFLTLTDAQKTSDEYVTLLEEEIILVLPAAHPLAKRAAPPGEPFATLPLKELQQEPFILMQKFSTMRFLTDSLFEEAGFSPAILFETKNNNTITAMIRSNLCCGLVPYYYIKDNRDGLACFSLPSHPTWEVCASYKKNSYLSNAARLFIELARDFWN